MPETPASTIEPSPPATPTSPAPASEPSPPPSTDDSGFDSSSADDGLDEAAIFADLGEVPPAEPVAPVTPPPTPAQAQTPPAAATEPAQPAQPEVTSAQVIEGFRNWRTQAEQVLSNSHYNLTQQDADALNTDPGQVIPKLMSRVYLDAVTAAVNVIAQALPYTVMNTIDTHNGYKQNESEFFSEWPGLQAHHAEVVRVGQVYRQLNPQASKADFVRSVGAQVAMALGLTAEQARGPAARQQQVGSRVLRHVPPAASARHPAPPPRESNIFTQMSQEEDE